MKTLIWLHKDWPNFNYKITQSVNIKEYDTNLAHTKNAIASFLIEGIILEYDTIFTRFKYQSETIKNGIVSAYLNACDSDSTLTIERILNWHSNVFQEMGVNNGGAFRSEKVIITDNTDTEIYVGIPSNRIEIEIQSLVDWVNNNNEPIKLIKAIVAHFWFESIHPFSDGNGRVGRILINFILKDPLPISHFLISNKYRYYREFIKNQRVSIENRIDISSFISFVLDSIQMGQKRDSFIEQLNTLNIEIKRVRECILFLYDNNLTSVSVNKYRKLFSTTSNTAKDEIDFINSLNLF